MDLVTSAVSCSRCKDNERVFVFSRTCYIESVRVLVHTNSVAHFQLI